MRPKSPAIEKIQTPRGPRKFTLGLERLFCIAGLTCVFVAGAAWFEAGIYQAREGHAFANALAARARHDATAADAPLGFPARIKGEHAMDREVLGRLEIPRLRVSTLVREGIDESTLRVAIGHIPGTSMPGRDGNVGLAGHRDTFFRGLRDARKGDLVRLTMLDGRREYRVESLEIVAPDRVDVLRAPAKGSFVTLVTCYPFDFIGRAPKRFVVKARLIEMQGPPAPTRAALGASG